MYQQKGTLKINLHKINKQVMVQVCMEWIREAWLRVTILKPCYKVALLLKTLYSNRRNWIYFIDIYNFILTFCPDCRAKSYWTTASKAFITVVDIPIQINRDIKTIKFNKIFWTDLEYKINVSYPAKQCALGDIDWMGIS